MATLTVFGPDGAELHQEEITTGKAINARRVTRACGKLVENTPGARVVVTTKRGKEDRKIVKKSENYYTREV